MVHLENFRVRAVYSPDLSRRLEADPGMGLWIRREDAEAQAVSWATGRDLYGVAGARDSGLLLEADGPAPQPSST
ncbi:hypothetical protein ACQKM2_20015 [Streptomyces sp. NPDC004126]|uniref:hypothetical protein n=1 Tax=Streptomyces sp. NPDC004126 TaxID=3390695 RepID=UPI003D0411DF